MQRCELCNEWVIRNNETLCYYHRKIRDGLIDPPVDPISSGIYNDKIWEYTPLVDKLAKFWATKCDIDKQDLTQEGHAILMELAYQVDWNMEPKQISNFIKTSLDGKLKRHIAHNNSVIRLPSFYERTINSVIIEYLDDEIYIPGAPSADVIYSRKELGHELQKIMKEVLDDRELLIINKTIYTDDPTTNTAIAAELGISDVMVGKIKSKAIIKLAVALASSSYDIKELNLFMEEEGYMFNEVEENDDT